jgi:glycine dehydrogenase
MLETVETASIDQLMADTLPQEIRCTSKLTLPPPLSETEALARAREVAAQNTKMISLIGQGYYGTVLPPVIQRNILENPAWYTAYTPYQPEISQGRLEALLNFQTAVSDLTGLEIANASLLDEATAAAEAMAMAHRIATSKRTTFFADQDCHPQTLAVIAVRAEALGWSVEIGDPQRDLDAARVFGAIFQYPGTLGHVRDLRNPIARLKAANAVSIVAADPLSLTLLKPPGELGADIAKARCNASGCRWATADRTPRISRQRTRTNALCPDALSASRSTAAASPPTGSHYRPASSISVGRRRLPTSARRRCCSL